MAQSLNSVIFKSHFLSLAVSLYALLPCAAWAQSTAQGSALVTASGSISATATVVQPLTISSTSTLNFGSFVAGTSAGTVTISANPYTRTSDNVRLVASNPGSVSTVVVTGVENTGFTVIFPQTVSLSTSAGGASMTLNTFTSSLLNNGGMVGTNGSQSFQVGARLNVGASETSGVYSGSVPITINYP